MIFLDSSFIIACKIKDDEHHQKSMNYLTALIDRNEEVVTSDYIFDEVVTVLFLKTKNLNIAAETGKILKSAAVILKINDVVFEKAWEIFSAQKNTRLSFTDCSTIALMREEGIKKLATFDEDFKKVKEIEVVRFG